MMNRTFRVSGLLSLILCAALAGCGDDDEGVDSNEEARRAYLGLDKMVGKALKLGFDGFNAASSANIPAQMGTGDMTGTISIGGQVDQGMSNNKEMRLTIALVNYKDAPIVISDEESLDVTYATDATLPMLELKLRGIPTGTFTGTLLGTFLLAGEQAGTVTLTLTLAGTLEMVPGGTADQTQRKAGTTMVTGTATSGEGTYQVMLTI